ncbi:MAG: FliM/FliN family flagellar motor switch protein [Planctomycetota bacterium]
MPAGRIPRIMAELSPKIADAVLAACRTNADEAAASLGRALDGKFQLAFEAPAQFQEAAAPEALKGPGLTVVLIVGKQGLLLLIPESTGLVPAWCAEPDPTGQSKLATLGQELGLLILPDDLPADDFKVGVVKNLPGAMKRGGVGDGAVMVPLRLIPEANEPQAWLVWPAPNPGMVLGAGSPPPKEGAPKPAEKAAPTAPAGAKAARPAPSGSASPGAGKPPAKPRPATPDQLPPYSRSLMRIRVPLVVVLAEQRQPLHRIVELGPGSIIQFDKSCEEMLDLEAGGHRIACGEAVKVGDKFGLRVTSIVLPEERFSPVPPPVGRTPAGKQPAGGT